jgi:hypothetical protein
MALLQLKDPSKKDLRWFAAVWFPAFWAIIGFLTWRRHHATAALMIWGVAGLLAIGGLLAPRIIRPLYILMTRGTYPIGWLMSHLFMILTYYVIFTAFGWCMRRFYDPMQRKLDRNSQSYWIDWEEPGSADEYFRQT